MAVAEWRMKMVDKGLGPSASEAGPAAMSPGVPPMSKAERLHRWADNLELQEQLQREALDDAALRTRDRWCRTPADRSPLAVAFEDWALQAEGLRSDRLEEAIEFFDLSEDEIRRIVGYCDHPRPTVPAAVAAERVRALAERAESMTVPQVGVLVTGASVAAVLGWMLVAS